MRASDPRVKYVPKIPADRWSALRLLLIPNRLQKIILFFGQWLA